MTSRLPLPGDGHPQVAAAASADESHELRTELVR